MALSALSPRTRGWLRFIWDKATTADDWSVNGTPHPWWDRYSTAPMCTFPRFDLSETAYILPVLADRTPAWREVYARIADELVGRHTTFWAAIDWLTLIGPDPNRDKYPPEWLTFLPPHLQGRYDPPGWTANGVAPWGLQPDPIGADGNLFFRGFFNFLLAIYRYVAGNDKWDHPFKVAGYSDRSFEWSHHRIAEFLHAQWREQPQGPHCENTKIWPYCLSAAGLGLQLTDQTTGTGFHSVFGDWVEFAKKNYLKVDRHGHLKEFPWYYDPIAEVVCGYQFGATPYAALALTPYMLPQNREFSEFLYRQASAMLGWDDAKKPLTLAFPDPRFLAIGRLTAQELGDTHTAARLAAHMEETCDPRWFGEEECHFGWWFGAREPYPRGQLSALVALCEASDGCAWSRAFQSGDQAARFSEPTVEGVDYPALGIAAARIDPASAVLAIETYAATPSRRGTTTRFRVVNLAEPAAVAVRVDGADYPNWRLTESDGIEIETTIDVHRITVATGRRAAKTKPDGAAVATSAGDGAAARRQSYSVAGVKSCSCC